MNRYRIEQTHDGRTAVWFTWARNIDAAWYQAVSAGHGRGYGRGETVVLQVPAPVPVKGASGAWQR